MKGIETMAAISIYVQYCCDCCGVGLNHKNGTGKAAANQITESKMIIFSALFFFGVTSYLGAWVLLI